MRKRYQNQLNSQKIKLSISLPFIFECPGAPIDFEQEIQDRDLKIYYLLYTR